jgi:hypothetical protein
MKSSYFLNVFSPSYENAILNQFNSHIFDWWVIQKIPVSEYYALIQKFFIRNNLLIIESGSHVMLSLSNLIVNIGLMRRYSAFLWRVFMVEHPMQYHLG